MIYDEANLLPPANVPHKIVQDEKGKNWWLFGEEDDYDVQICIDDDIGYNMWGTIQIRFAPNVFAKVRVETIRAMQALICDRLA